MKQLLIISFDLIREGESEKSLAISSIIAYLKNDMRYGVDFSVSHLPINMFKLNKETRIEDLAAVLSRTDFASFDFIALSAYIWNEFLTNGMINYIKDKFGYKGKFILGGYQISYSSNPEQEYPNCDHFISGYAEKSLLDIVTGVINQPRVKSPVDFSTLPSPYLTQELPIIKGQKMLRLETKRGCPYRCSFCAHRDLTFNKVYKHNQEKVYREIALFKDLQVKKINIIDPIFNAGKEYLSVLEEMCTVNLCALISMQARFETIVGTKGEAFLDYYMKLNVILEFGLQTAIQEESKVINRKNNPQKIKEAMQRLKERGILFEISLIYGLPNQTLDSFKESIDFALENGCTNLTAFPLMLLKGTELYAQKDLYKFREQAIGEYNIPIVTSSDSFSEREWYKMKNLAETLQPNQRIL